MKRKMLIVPLIAGAFAALVVVSRRWSVACPAWLGGWLKLDFPYMPSILGSTAVVEHAGIEPGMKVLDVGPGPGRISLPAARKVGQSGEVVALDIQPGMLSQLEERAHQAGVHNIRPVLGDIAVQPLEPDTFDRALLVAVLGEIGEKEAALRNIFKALKPGGVLSVTEILPDPHYQRRSKVLALAHEAGFQEAARWGNTIAFTLNLEKPPRPPAEPRSDRT